MWYALEKMRSFTGTFRFRVYILLPLENVILNSIFNHFGFIDNQLELLDVVTKHQTVKS